MNAKCLRIVEFSDSLAGEFYRINAQWINDMFVMEDADRITLENPRHKIMDPGGTILFVEADGLGIVGACALRKESEGVFELTKMGVLESARGRKAGEFLLEKMIERAKKMKAVTLYLLTSKKCAAAIHLYEKTGFVHDPEIMACFGGSYDRCDVAMRFVG